jgi:hypothetical protein
MERVLVLRCEGGNWEIRFRREPWWERWLRAWRENRTAPRLAALDENTLKDIGLGHSACHPLARRIHAHRHAEFRRLAVARLGLI